MAFAGQQSPQPYTSLGGCLVPCSSLVKRLLSLILVEASNAIDPDIREQDAKLVKESGLHIEFPFGANNGLSIG